MVEAIEIEDILNGMDDLVGLGPYKDAMRGIVKAATPGSIAERPVHYAYVGNPGRGKVAVAGMMGRILGRMGVIKRGLFLELDRDDMTGLSGEQAVRKLSTAAATGRGGILFIDDAPAVYRLTGQLFRDLLEQRETIVVLSGSKDEMDQLLAMPEFVSKVALALYFPDFTPGELLEVAVRMAEDYQLTMTDGAKEKLLQLLTQKQDRIGQLGNARYAKHLVDRAYRNAASRIMGEEDADKLLPDDIEDVG